MSSSLARSNYRFFSRIVFRHAYYDLITVLYCSVLIHGSTRNTQELHLNFTQAIQNTRPRPKTIESRLRRWLRLRLYLLRILPRLSFHDDESESYSPTHESHYERDSNVRLTYWL